jgi:hypothetical protein
VGASGPVGQTRLLDRRRPRMKVDDAERNRRGPIEKFPEPFGNLALAVVDLLEPLGLRIVLARQQVALGKYEVDGQAADLAAGAAPLLEELEEPRELLERWLKPARVVRRDREDERVSILDRLGQARARVQGERAVEIALCQAAIAVDQGRRHRFGRLERDVVGDRLVLGLWGLALVRALAQLGQAPRRLGQFAPQGLLLRLRCLGQGPQQGRFARAGRPEKNDPQPFARH